MMDKPKESLRQRRVLKSCTECQRRKQKCNREWPCNHCRARNAPHLCIFGRNKSVRSRNSKISNDDTPLNPSALTDASGIESDAGLEAWGYMPDHRFFNLGTLLKETPRKRPTSITNTQLEELAYVLQIIPPRSLTDMLVESFLHGPNYYYYAIYPPSFLEEYVRWWETRAVGQKPSVEFTCLLLRVCAHSAQYLDKSKEIRIERELSESAQSLGERCHNAAERLSHTLRPGVGGLIQVQQLFLTACWLKSEARFVESWHILSSAIREAQEIGMHKDSLSRELTEFELEMRRRVWCILYMWDWQMSRWLSRPRLIDHGSCSFQLPNCRLEESHCEQGLISPFAHIKLYCQIARQLSEKFGKVGGNPRQILERQEEIETCIHTFPPVLSITMPDTSWDNKFPRVALQRHQLHVLTFMTLLDPLKPYLTNSFPQTEVSMMEVKLQAIGVDCCLKLLHSTQGLFDLMFPTDARNFLLVWCFFDAATILCSAVVHDRNACRLPQRDKIFEAIEIALGRLSQLSFTSRAGALSYAILSKLVGAMPSLASHWPLLDSGLTPQQIISSETIPELEMNNEMSFADDRVLLDNFKDLDDVETSSGPLLSQGWQNMQRSSCSVVNGLPDLLSVELGELGELWDWDMLKLDPDWK